MRNDAQQELNSLCSEEMQLCELQIAIDVNDEKLKRVEEHIMSIRQKATMPCSPNMNSCIRMPRRHLLVPRTFYAWRIWSSSGFGRFNHETLSDRIQRTNQQEGKIKANDMFGHDKKMYSGVCSECGNYEAKHISAEVRDELQKHKEEFEPAIKHKKIRELIAARRCYGWAPNPYVPGGKYPAYVNGIDEETNWLDCEIPASYNLLVNPEAFTPSPDALFFKGSGPSTDEECRREVSELWETFEQLGLCDMTRSVQVIEGYGGYKSPGIGQSQPCATSRHATMYTVAIDVHGCH